MATSTSIKRTYYVLSFGNILAASMIWGINTIFLLDAGLSNFEAFAANAFFTLGMVAFEVPTGIVADIWGRRISFLLGTLTLSAGTGLYVFLWYLSAPFWQWAIVSVILGLGFTFFSGAVEAWLVDALGAIGYTGQLESVFARVQIISGMGMLMGSVGGGLLAQVTNLGVPFIVRSAILVIMFFIAVFTMRDIGFVPDRSAHPLKQMRRIVSDSVTYGWRIRAVKYLMIAAIFTGGVSIYVFYALQPYLLDLYGDDQAYGIAGLVAAIIGGSQTVGGLLAPAIRSAFRRRTSVMLIANSVGAFSVVLIGILANLWVAIVMIVIWGLLAAASFPIRQAYLNDMIPSQQRATILSMDSLMSSSGGIVTQPVLGRAADVWGYPVSYVLAGLISALSVPFIARSRMQNSSADIGLNTSSAEKSDREV
ncbi:MAG: MFS transporter [Longispora sp.]|nr:MFS transporter [Longispora sp. (in: high G+C Gram-positive bacteria)]